MGGKSFTLNPLQTLRIVSTSMICGENMYYRPTRNDTFGKGIRTSDAVLTDYVLFPDLYNTNASYHNHIKTSSDYYFTQIVNKALDYDYGGTLEFIGELRNDYYMRLNSHVLVVLAIHHSSRVNFNLQHPNKMKLAIQSTCLTPADWSAQFKLLKETNRPIPTIWKKTIAGMLENMSRYHASKYIHGSKSGNSNKPLVSGVNPNSIRSSINGKTHYPTRFSDEPKSSSSISDKMSLVNLVDLVRITHPRPTRVIDELIQTGKVQVNEAEQTWEKLRSANKSWFEITEQIQMPHMALLRNLRNISEEFEIVITETVINDAVIAMYTKRVEELGRLLISGVKNGKQFPFRYYSAYKMLKYRVSEYNRFTEIFINSLNKCMLESLDMIPVINGRVDCLTDNSWSSRTGMTSEYSTTDIYEIANLASLLTAYRSSQGGSVWIFGDGLEEYPVSSEKPIMTQLDEINEIGNNIGQATETGIWLFWEMAIRTNKKLDTVFIYSDMQAGHGQLYTNDIHHKSLEQYSAKLTERGDIDILYLVKTYRESVCSKVNVFSVQVAGYDNTIMPDILYRGAILSGWTGKEAKLAYEMIRVWDEAESAL